MKKGCTFIFVLLAVILILIVVGLFNLGSDSAGSSSKHGAWAYMQQFVEKKLKSPKTAEFPSHGSQYVTEFGGDRYRVRAFVDSQNSFGATVRTEFEGVIKAVDEGWELEELSISDLISSSLQISRPFKQ